MQGQGANTLQRRLKLETGAADASVLKGPRGHAHPMDVALPECGRPAATKVPLGLEALKIDRFTLSFCVKVSHNEDVRCTAGSQFLAPASLGHNL